MTEILVTTRRFVAMAAGALLVAAALTVGGATAAHADTDCWGDPAATDPDAGDSGACANTGGTWGGNEDWSGLDGGSGPVWTCDIDASTGSEFCYWY